MGTPIGTAAAPRIVTAPPLTRTPTVVVRRTPTARAPPTAMSMAATARTPMAAERPTPTLTAAPRPVPTELARFTLPHTERQPTPLHIIHLPAITALRIIPPPRTMAT